MRKRILIVDDIGFNIEFESQTIKKIMTELDIKVTVDEAHTVQDALNKIKKNALYDAMIIDIHLPDGTGVDIADYAKKKSKKTRLAALTIYPDAYEAASSSFDLLMKKPIMPKTFKQSLLQLLQIG